MITTKSIMIFHNLTMKHTRFHHVSMCLCVCVFIYMSPSHAFFFEASYWSSDHMTRSRPLIGQSSFPTILYFFFAQLPLVGGGGDDGDDGDNGELVSPVCGIFFKLFDSQNLTS